jgi:hypothetical protein
MVILTTNNVNQQVFRFIPRSRTFDSVKITDEQTNVTTIINAYTFEAGDYWCRLSAIFNLKENHFYTIEIKDGSTIIFRDKIFCTDQSTSSFSVNNAQYTSNSTQNTFIVYE